MLITHSLRELLSAFTKLLSQHCPLIALSFHIIEKWVCRGYFLPYIRWVMTAQRFTPNKLIFEHTACSPSAVLKDQWDTDEPPTNILNYVHDFWHHLLLLKIVELHKKRLNLSILLSFIVRSNILKPDF